MPKNKKRRVIFREPLTEDQAATLVDLIVKTAKEKDLVMQLVNYLCYFSATMRLGELCGNDGRTSETLELLAPRFFIPRERL